jgi:integrase
LKKIINRDFEQDTYFQKWLIGLSPRTKHNYTIEFPNWLAFIDLSPTEQIKKRMHDLNSEDISQRTFFEQKFREYKEYLESIRNPDPLKHETIRGKLRTVASFFARNGLPLFLKRGDWESTQQQPVIQRIKLTKDDVKAMYAHGNLRDRALLLVLAQSGFSEIDVSCFKIEELKGFYDNAETEHYFIEKPREKTNEIQATCLSYEAMHDLKAMLQERGNPASGFLFVSQTKGKGDQLETRSINDAMKALAQKSFSQEKAKEFKTKALRSFYNSALLRASVSPQELKDLMFGHGRKGARGHYDYDEQTIKEAYGKVFEHVSINGLQVRNDLKKVMDGLENLNQLNALFRTQLEAKDKEIGEVKSELRALSETIKAIADSAVYKELADGVMEQVADKLVKDPAFSEKFKKNAEKIKRSTLGQ